MAHHAAAPRRAATRAYICARNVGARGRRPALVAGHGRWHGPWIGLKVVVRHSNERRPEPAAPSPFPPRSPTTRSSRTATRAPSWHRTARSTGCACPASTRRASSARSSTAQAGLLRFGPFGINHPTRARLRAGTNVLVTTWKTPSGWVVVRDALTMGPRDREDQITPHTRPPADDDGDHMLVRTVECIDGPRRDRAGLRARIRLRPEPAEWTLVDGDRHAADATGAGVTVRLHTDLALGIEGGRVRAPAHARARRPGASARCRGPRDSRAPVDVDEATARIDTTTGSGAWLGRARIPDHRWRDPIQRSALTIKGLTYMPTGATVAALTTSLPETPGGERNWDYRYTWMRDTTFTLQALHWLNLDWEADEFMQFIADVEADGGRLAPDHVRHRRPARPHRDDTRRPVGLRGRAPGAHRQRRVRPAPERRLRRGARLDPPAHPTRPAPPARLWPIVESPGRVRHRACGASPTRASGRRAANRSTTCRRSSCAGSRSTAPPSSPRFAATGRSRTKWRTVAEEITQRHPRPRRDASAACCASTTRRTHSTHRCCSPRSSASCPPTTRGCARPSTAIADELTENGFVLRYRTDETDDGLSGKEGTFLICSFWLVSALAIVGDLQRARDLMEKLLRDRVAARSLRRGVRRRHGSAPRQLPAGVLAPRAARGRGADHPPRAPGRVLDALLVVAMGKRW